MIFLELFITFFLIGLLTFGGGYAMIPMIQDQVVSKGWIDSNALTNFIAISECTPGPFAVNIATFIGSNVGGPLGAVCATIGVTLPSFIIIILVAFIMNKIIKTKVVQGALAGIRPVVVSLILSTAIIFFIKVIFYQGNAVYSTNISFDLKAFTLFIILLSFIVIYKAKQKKSLNPILLLVLSAVLGIIIFK